MPREHPHAGTLLCLLHLPEPNDSIEATIGEQAPIGPPGHRVHRAAIASEHLEIRATGGVPEANGGTISAAGERVPIRGKGDAVDDVGMLARPEQGATRQPPQLNETIPAPSGQRASLRADTEVPNRGGMRDAPRMGGGCPPPWAGPW